MEKNQKTQSQQPEEATAINLKDLLYTLLGHWHWFALSLFICLAVALLVSKSAVKYYNRTATIMLKDKKTGGSSASDLLVSNNLLSMNGSSVVENELQILKSRTLMMQVVERLNLGVEYSYTPLLRKTDLYSNSPVHVQFPDEGPYSNISLTVVPSKQGGRVILKNFPDSKKVISAPLNDTVNTPVGRVVVIPTWTYASYAGKEIQVDKRNIKSVTKRYRNAVHIARVDKLSNAVSLSLEDPSGDKAEDILNTLVQIYREEAVKDKAMVIDQSITFINARISELDQDLGVMEAGKASFMRNNRLINVDSYGQDYLRRSDEYMQDREVLENQIAIVDYLTDFVNGMKDEYKLVPAEMGLKDPQLGSVISEYNTTLLQKQKLDAKGNMSSNPVTKNINASLQILKGGVSDALTALRSNLKQQLARSRQLENQAGSKVQAVPEHQNYITSVEREQNVKQSLYLFLLNRREELSLSKAALEDDVRVIDAADGSTSPTKPRTSMIFLVAIVLGLAIPVGIFFLLKMMDTDIHSKRDVEEGCSVPIVGDVPKQTAEQEKGSIIVARENGRDSISESFRIIRSNLDYIKTDRPGCKVAMFTSFFPNSGKSFLSTNLSVLLAASGKRVLLVDADIRKGTLHKKLPNANNHGLSNYLSGKIELEELLKERRAISSGWDAIFSGPVPPNPAELLDNVRMDAFIEAVRPQYDYVLLDAVPAGIVADADILKRLADLTVFVIRANVTDKRALGDLETMYKENRFPKLCVIVND
ncbi:MAG: polysaccharide biosynthesis tyrosine autokinase, partial [Bacteroidales bacterium]|nr:polysaccharide biosynthesis tyrosine autokinase [Bacteroidales bacterium]